jgi:hypothetical protein
MPTFEYKRVNLLPGIDGVAAVDAELNRLGAEGWLLMDMVLPGGCGIMRREIE